MRQREGKWLTRLLFINYNCGTFTLRQTKTFRKWFARLRDERAATAITARLDRLSLGHSGDARPVGKDVSELRVHHGPGYRVYFRRQGSTIIVLLCGEDKGSQQRDIKTEWKLAAETQEGP